MKMCRVKFTGITFLLVCVLSLAAGNTANAQIIDIVLTASKKVIKAVDLKIQRMQNATIKLQNAQQALQNALSKLKLDEISDWAKKQKELYQTFYDELWKIKSAIAWYRRIKDIIAKQVALVGEYKSAWAMLKNDGNFSPGELKYMGDTYAIILEESVKNIDQLLLVVNAFTTQMSDGKRLEIIQQVSDKIDGNMNDLVSFNSSNAIISKQRSKEQIEINTIRKLYGIK